MGQFGSEWANKNSHLRTVGRVGRTAIAWGKIIPHLSSSYDAVARRCKRGFRYQIISVDRIG